MPGHRSSALRVGLTGGIGAGKSTVAARLADRGALVVDADALARQVLEPGEPAVQQVLDQFGPAVLAADGSLDRSRLAAIVFADPEARSALEAIVHPEVARRARAAMAAAEPGSVVVYDVPLLTEKGMADQFDLVVVVVADADGRRDRLVGRGLDPADAAARIAAQADDAERKAVADVVIDNSGPVEELDAQVDALWQRLVHQLGLSVPGSTVVT
ncbi:MAG: dephospho-CoA kinase [Actinomycetes bacterium]